MAKRAKLEMKFDVEYVPVPEDRLGAWRAGLSLLLQLFQEERRIYKAEVVHEFVRAGFVGDDHRVRTSLFPVANVAQGKKASKTGGLHAWVIGHDGSVHRMALAEWRV